MAKIDPDLVVNDEKGKPFTVRYDEVNTMLLNEFLKEHQRVTQEKAIIAKLEASETEQAATITELKTAMAEQQKEVQSLTVALKGQAAEIQKVNAQLKANQTAPRLVAED